MEKKGRKANMISLILFILIGIKLNMMNGLYLSLIIIYLVVWLIQLICNIVKFTLKIKEH